MSGDHLSSPTALLKTQAAVDAEVACCSASGLPALVIEGARVTELEMARMSHHGKVRAGFPVPWWFNGAQNSKILSSALFLMCNDALFDTRRRDVGPSTALVNLERSSIHSVPFPFISIANSVNCPSFCAMSR